MRDQADVELIQQLLEGAGLGVSRLKETTEERCDLHGGDGVHQYLVEVKGFHDDDALKAAIRDGETHQGQRALYYSPTIATATRKAVDQLASTAESANVGGAFRMVALLAQSHFGRRVTAKQIYGTLYGERPIICKRADGTDETRGCLYLRNSVFFRHRDLDAAIVCDDTANVSLHLNDYGHRTDEFRGCALWRHFADVGAANDASTLEQSGRYFWADCDLDRAHGPAVLEYVKKKYQLSFALDLDLTEHSATSRLESGH